MSKLVSEEQWLENICYNCNLSFENGCASRGDNYCENYKKLKKDLELLEILKHLVLGIGTEEDISAARKHFEMEIKQAFEKSHEGCMTIKLDLEDKENE